MIRFAPSLLCLALVAAPALATDYSASLAVPTSGRLITPNIVWNCGAAACQGATDESRPLVLCESLAKQAGKVASFVADGRALAAADLDRCNASAKAQAGQAPAGK